ncbi:MAG: Crp/Fnr family transcriptional regulator [Candidatus Nitrosomaritimum yanchengensis]
MGKKKLLEYIAGYVQLTGEEEELLLSHAMERNYLKGQYIVQQGDVCDKESFVLNGCTRTFYLDGEGNEHVVMFAIENWWVADMGSFTSKTPATYNVQCLDHTEVIQFTYDALEFLYRKIPKLERFFRLIIQKAFIASEKRILSNFSLTAKERYSDFLAKYPKIEQKVPQYMVASYLGITKEFLSKIRSEMRNTQVENVNLV